jgi:hypothetical protein
MAEKFKDAVGKSIRNFYNGRLPEKAIEASQGEFRFTPEYFDEMKEEPEKKSKKAKEPTEDDPDEA